MLDVTRVRGQFNLVNAFNLTTTEKMTLVSKYGVNRRFFNYIDDPSQIPRFVAGDRKDQMLFIIDIPCHHKLTTISIPTAIDDSHNITIFTNPNTKYVIPIVNKLLNEKMDNNYECANVLLDTFKFLSNRFLNAIRNIDNKRVRDKRLLRDKSKHRNRDYTDHLTMLQVEASGFVTSIASDLQLLKSLYKLFRHGLSTETDKSLRDNIIIYNQILIEAKFSASRIEKVLDSFTRRVQEASSYKLSFLSVIAFVLFPSDSFFGFMGINLPPNSLGQMGLPIKNVWAVLIIASIFDLIAWTIWHFWIKRR